MYLLREQVSYEIIIVGYIVFRMAERAVDALDEFSERFLVSVALVDHALPIPLVNVNAVDIVKLLLTADSRHIRIKSLSLAVAVLRERHTLPFCERMDYLTVRSVKESEPNGRLPAVQIIVKARALGNEERRADAFKVKRQRKPFLKCSFYEGYSLLRLVYVKDGGISLGDK